MQAIKSYADQLGQLCRRSMFDDGPEECKLQQVELAF